MLSPAGLNPHTSFFTNYRAEFRLTDFLGPSGYLVPLGLWIVACLSSTLQLVSTYK